MTLCLSYQIGPICISYQNDIYASHITIVYVFVIQEGYIYIYAEVMYLLGASPRGIYVLPQMN